MARLTWAGFAVPHGFIIPTDAYREFVNANRWLSTIQSAVENLSAEDASALEKASTQIRVAFSAGKIPEETEAAIRTAYADFEDKPVAVRSSATAEDLPDLSFAGQQDTYLNVIGIEQLLVSSHQLLVKFMDRSRNRIPDSQSDQPHGRRAGSHCAGDDSERSFRRAVYSKSLNWLEERMRDRRDVSAWAKRLSPGRWNRIIM